MQCKICGKEVNYKYMKRHLKKYHDVEDLFLYGRDYSVDFVLRIKGMESIVLTDFDGLCKICGSTFFYVFNESGAIEVKRCNTPNCSNRNPSRRIKQFFEDGSELEMELQDRLNERILDTRASYDKFVLKYGKIEGSRRYDEWIKLTSGSIESFILRHGEEEGRRRYDEFCRRSANTKDRFIERYGQEEGIRRYESHKENHKSSSPRTLQYWISDADGDIMEALSRLRDFQSRDVNFFVKKYGIEEGHKKYAEMNKKKSNNSTFKYYQERYGVEEGKRRFLNKLIKNNGRRSKISDSFGKTLSLFLQDIGLSSKKEVQIKDYDNLCTYFIDFYVPEIALIVEFYGDYWHANPSIYSEDYTIRGDKKARDIWESDKDRSDRVSNLMEGETIVVWEGEWKKEGTLIIKGIINYIKENYEWKIME